MTGMTGGTRKHKRRKVHQFTHYGLGYPLAYQGSYWHVGDGPCHDAPSADAGGDAGASAGDGGMAAAASVRTAHELPIVNEVNTRDYANAADWITRRPFLYDPETNYIHLGKWGSHHGMIEEAMGLPSNNFWSKGWVSRPADGAEGGAASGLFGPGMGFYQAYGETMTPERHNAIAQALINHGIPEAAINLHDTKDDGDDWSDHTASSEDEWDAGPQPLQPEDVEDKPTAVHNGYEFYQLPPMENVEPRKATEEDILHFCKKWGIDPSVLTPEAKQGIMHNRNNEYEREFRKNKSRPVFDMTRTPILHDAVENRFWVGQPGDFHENIMRHFPVSENYPKGYYKNAPDSYSAQGEHGMFYTDMDPEAKAALRQHMLTQPSFAGWTDEQIKANGPSDGPEPSSSSGVFSHTTAWEDIGLLHHNDFGKPCRCTFYNHQAWHHTAGKLHDFLMNPKSRPDLQTPEAQGFLHTLDYLHKQTDGKVDALTPWLAREWKKGRIEHHPANPDNPYSHGLMWYNYHPEVHPETERALDPETLGHWADFMRSSHPLKREMGDIMQHKIRDFHHRIADWDKDMKDRASAKALAGGEVVHSLPDGWTIRNLKTPEELRAEGDTMGHCVGGYHQDVERGRSIIHSLRDPKGIPHATIEISPNQYEEPHPDAWLDHAFENDPVARHLPPDAKRDIRTYHDYRKSVDAGDSDAWQAQHGPLNDDIRVGWQGFYNQLHGKYTGWGRKALPHGGEVVQIQGRSNDTPKPEYQERIKHYFLNHYSDDERPKSGDPGYYDRNGYWVDELRHPDHIPEVGTQDDPYGLNAKPMDADWDDLMDNISFNSHGYYDTHNGDHVHDIYELAKHRGEIPQLAKATEGYQQDQQEKFDEWLDMNYDHAPRYPEETEPHGYQGPDGDEVDEGEGKPYWEPNGPEGERHFDHKDAEGEYESAMDSWTEQHPGLQAANHMYGLLKPHYNPESSEYANELYNPDDQGKQREVFGTWTQLDARPNDPLMVHNQQDPLPSQKWLDHDDYHAKDHEHVWGANAECEICGQGYSEWQGPAHSDTHQTVAPHPEDPVRDLRNMAGTVTDLMGMMGLHDVDRTGTPTIPPTPQPTPVPEEPAPPVNTSQMAAQHTGTIPGDELWAKQPIIERRNPRSGVNTSYIGSVDGNPAYIKPEGNFHSDDMAKERAAFYVAHAMGIDMPHTVVHPVTIPKQENMYHTTPEETKLSQIQQGIRGGDLIDTHTPTRAAEQFPEDTRRIALLDHVIANNDRHMGNVILGVDGKLRPIDHGGSFIDRAYYPSAFASHHVDTPLTPEEIAALHNALRCDTVACGISPEAHQAMVERIQRMLASGKMNSSV